MKTPTNWAVYIRKNENRALSEIYSEHRSTFIGWVQNKSNCSRDEALEIFQVSIVILYENVMSGKLSKLDNVKSYLFTIGKNKMMEHFRKIKKTQHQEIDDKVLLKSAVAEEFELTEDKDDVFKISDALKQLGDPCKTLLENFYFRKMSLEEISVEMQYKNTDTVKTKKFKCIQRLRKMYH